MKIRPFVIPAIIILVFVFTIAAWAQTGTPLLKVVVDEKGNAQVFDMQGNEVGPNTVQVESVNSKQFHRSGIQDFTIPTIQSKQITLSEQSKVGPASSVQVRSTTQPVPIVPEDALMDPDRRNTQSIRSGSSDGPPHPVNLLESDNPEAKLYVERMQLDKVQMDPGPNLTAQGQPASYSFSDPNLTINVRVRNSGTTACGTYSYLGYFLSSNTTITTGDWYLGNDYVPDLAAGAYSDETITVNLSTILGLPAGTYYIGFIIDYTSRVTEDNENDNAWYFSPSITTAGGTPAPNLTKRAAYTHSFSYSAPNLTISTSVTNTGNAASGSSYLGYYLSTNTIISEIDYNIGQDYVAALAVGSYSNETETIDLSSVSGLPTGTYYVGYIIDHTGIITEINENDNYYGWSSPTITYAGQPNLTASGQPASYSFTEPNLTINVRVRNSGAASAGSSYLGYYLSSNTSINTSDYRIGTDYVAALASGAYSDETISVNLHTVAASPALPVGTHTYYIGFIIDMYNAVAESNENDNNWYFTPTISFTRPSGQPNLTAIGQPASYSFTEPNLTVNVRVRNNGTASAGSSTLGYYLSDNNSILTSDHRIGTDNVSALVSGAYSDETISVNLHTIAASPALPVGTHTYYIGFIIDMYNGVAESNEGDNSYYFSPTISFTRPPSGQPNLLAETGSCSYSFTGGNELIIFVRTTNNGAVDAGPSHLAYYLSEDNIIGHADYRIAEDYQHTISPGAHEDDSCRINVQTIAADPNLPDGTHTYYVGFILDYRFEVAESNEGDNAYYYTTPITFTRGAPKRRYFAHRIAGDLPVIDGLINEMAWAFAPIEELTFGGVPGAWEAPWTQFDDNHVWWKALWSPSSNKLFLAVFVHDDVAGNCDHNYDNMWQDDAVEIYTDGDMSGGGYSGNPVNAQQWMIRRDNARHLIYEPGAYTGSAIQTAVRHYWGGTWSLEVAMEIYDQYNTNRKTLSVGDVIGWEVWYNDSDNAHQDGGLFIRDHQVGWAYTGPAWDNANYMQELEFVGESERTIVRFQVNMVHELAYVNPGDLIGVRGSHNPLSWSQTIPMHDPEGDGIFTADVDFTGIAPGTMIEYKFVHHAPPDDNNTGVVYEPNPGPYGPYYNREAILSGATEVLPLVYWNNDPTSVEEEEDVPLRFELSQNYPNPFNPETEIRYSIPEDSDVRLLVFNMSGSPVRSLKEGRQEAGTYSVFWDGMDDSGLQVSSGVYFIILKAGSFTQTRKAVLLR
jgi:subtilase family serine protease